MIVTAIALFRGSFALDPKIQPNSIGSEKSIYDVPPNIFVGRLLSVNQGLESTLLYDDLEDIGGYFANFYSLRLSSIDISLPNSSEGFESEELEVLSNCLLDDTPRVAEARILDNTIGVCLFDFHIDAERLRGYGPKAACEINAAINFVVRASMCKQRADLTERPIELLRRMGGFVKPNPVYSFDSRGSVVIPWVHKIFSLEKSEFREVQESGILKALISEETIRGFVTHDQRGWFGWGDSLRFIDSRMGWREGAVLAQFFYYSLEILNQNLSRLSVELFEKRKKNQRRTLRFAESLKYSTQSAIHRYLDARLFLAGTARYVFLQYCNSWNMQELSDAIREKTANVESMVVSINESLRRLSATIVEAILFASSVVGFIGLSINLHDYLKAETIHTSAQSLYTRYSGLGMENILAYSQVIVGCGLTIYVLAKCGFFSSIAALVRKRS